MSIRHRDRVLSLPTLSMMVLAVGLLAGCATADRANESAGLKTAEAQMARAPDIPEAGEAALYPDLVPFEVSNHPPGSCMREEEIAADLFLRMRTELMVTGLTCQNHYDEPELYSRYVTFTVDHQAHIRKVQDVMGRFFARNQRGNRNRLVDEYITQTANGESRVMRTVSTKAYCKQRRPQYEALTSFTSIELLEHISTGVERYRPAYSVCAS